LNDIYLMSNMYYPNILTQELLDDIS